MSKRRIAAVLGAAAIAGLLAVAPAGAAPKAPQSISVSASVAGQQCQGGDSVLVRLKADATSSIQPVAFRWDFTNNGSLDSPLRKAATITHSYPDEVTITARVVTVNAGREKAADTVRFGTLRCP
jgi:hypothetical protein